MENIDGRVLEVYRTLRESVPGMPVDYNAALDLESYALLIVALEGLFEDGPEPCIERAITYLRDCDSDPRHARGRLLLRAAERALRSAGDIL